MLAYTRARRQALKHIPLPSIPPIKASITLHCHCSCIYATRIPTHRKPKTTQKNACMPPPEPGDAPFNVSPSTAFGNCVRVAHRRPRCNEKIGLFIYAAHFSTHYQPKSRACKQMKASVKAKRIAWPSFWQLDMFLERVFGTALVH